MAQYSKQLSGFVLKALFVLCYFPVIVARGMSKRQHRKVQQDQSYAKRVGPRKSDMPNTRRRRALTLPPPEGLKTPRIADQSRCNLVSKLPFEIRELIWGECIGGMTFHLEIRDRRLKSILCCSSTPASCDDNTGYGCHRYQGLSEYAPGCLISLPLTCHQIYSEAIPILYSKNRFTTNRISVVEFLPLTLLTSRFDVIGSMGLKWYLTDFGSDSLTSKTSFQMQEWVAIWRILANMKGLQSLRVTICHSRRVWEQLSKTQAAEAVRPIMAITKPTNFTLNLPFACPSDEAPWTDLPCRIGVTPSVDIY